MKLGIVSGYFNPVHFGHIEYITEAKSLCDQLVVIVNNDTQVELKGSQKFMDCDHRCKIMSALKSVNWVYPSLDVDKTVCQTLKLIKKIFPEDELYFFNSGDRTTTNLESAETKICEELGIKEVVLNQPKRYSSSDLLKAKI